jgi:hypothetical protein
MSVSLQIRKQVDRIAKGRHTMQAAFSTGDEFWTKVDAAADETYENRGKGATITALDDALATAGVWSVPALKAWFDLHSAYFGSDLALDSPRFVSYLASVGWRVPYEASESLVDALGNGSRLPFQWVFGKGTLVADEADPAAAGMHRFGYWTGTSTWTAVDGLLDATKIKAAPVVCISREADPGGSTPILTPTLQDGTVIAAGVGFTASATQYGQVIIGKQAITGITTTTLANDTVTCAATGQFKVGEWVLLMENADGDTSLREPAQIKTLNANTSLVFESGLVNTFSNAGFILPMYCNVIRKSGTITTGTHNLDFYALPDRIIAL